VKNWLGFSVLETKLSRIISLTGRILFLSLLGALLYFPCCCGNTSGFSLAVNHLLLQRPKVDPHQVLWQGNNPPDSVLLYTPYFGNPYTHHRLARGKQAPGESVLSRV